jgi:hypothetical protein
MGGTERRGRTRTSNVEEIAHFQKYGKKWGKSWKLVMDRLRKMSNSANPNTAETASKLYHSLQTNPSDPTLDEKWFMERMGIKVTHYPISVFYHGKMERVTVSWRVKTANSDEALKVAMTAPSNDEVKRSIQRNWLLNSESDVKRIEDELLRSGRTYEKWWLEKQD